MGKGIAKAALEVKLPSEEEVRKALGNYPAMVGNQVLYDMCRDNPSQQALNAVVSKFWLIGRAYSVSAERRRTRDEKPLAVGEDFYEHRLAPAYIQANLDPVFAPLYEYKDVTQDNLGHILGLHCSLCKILETVTHQWKRSLASKYLHFHFPALYFIYDSRAINTLNDYVCHWSKTVLPVNSDYDLEYHRFSEAMMLLRDKIRSQYGISLTPRQLDRLLLKY